MKNGNGFLPYSGYEDINPEMAATYLERNTTNRKLRQSLIDKFARDMSNGKWMVTHQGIAFDESGNLLDGQHRLWAIAESGCTMRFLVTRMLRPEANNGIDAGMNRTPGDILHFQGMQASNKELAIVTLLLKSGMANRIPTRTEVVEAYLVHKDATCAVLRWFPNHKKRIAIAGVLAPIVRAWYSQDRSKLARFSEVLFYGVGAIDEKMIMLLRDFLLTLKTASGGEITNEIYSKTERALYAYLNGEKIAKLHTATSELFPLPGEDGPNEPTLA